MKLIYVRLTLKNKSIFHLFFPELGKTERSRESNILKFNLFFPKLGKTERSRESNILKFENLFANWEKRGSTI